MKRFNLFLLLIAFSISAYGQIVQTVVAQNLSTPWEIMWGMDDHIWVTERTGVVSRIDPATGDKKIVLTIDSVMTGGERGLMGMAINYTTAIQKVYIAYTYNSGGQTKVRVVQYSYDPGTDTLVSPFTIIENIAGNSNHDGCRLAIDGSYLFVTTGDAEDLGTPQNSNSINGKILRFYADGSIPPDNPIPGSPMWSKGHRNPQGLVIANGRMYSSEHGPSDNDEVNIIEMARNYGWPNVHGFCDDPGEMTFCNDSNVAEPIAAWTPTLAVAGIDYYNHTLIPDFTNSLLVVSLKAGRLTQLQLNTAGDSVIQENTIINNTYGRLRDICISPDGRVFISTSNRDGRGNPVPADDRIIELKSLSSGMSYGESEDFNIYPNPLSNGEAIRIDFAERFSGTFTIADVSGKVLYRRQMNNVQSDRINLEGITAGFYFIHLVSDSYTATKKIVIN